MKPRQATLAALALLLPPVVGGLVWLLLLHPVGVGVVAGEQAWRAEEGELKAVASHASELAAGHLVEAMEQVVWLRDRLRPGAAATFLEAVARAAAELSLDRVEVRRPGSENDPATGLRLERVAMRVVAPYPKIAALWDRLQRQQATAVCSGLSVRRYGDRVAATFEVALPVDVVEPAQPAQPVEPVEPGRAS